MPTSSPLSDDLRRLAETPDRYTSLSGTVERFADERVCIMQGPTWAAISDVHVPPDRVESLVDEVRRLVPPEKWASWWIGPSSEPGDLHERLEALGFREPRDRGTLLHALACATPPPDAPARVEVRRVETLADYELQTAIGWNAFGIPEERRERERSHLPGNYEADRRAGTPVGFIASVDGEAVGTGRSVYSPLGVFLIGGAVLEHARGRGVYRALVRARWDDAAARGTPGLVVEALPDTSYPILTRLGFVEVCAIRRLEDPR